jgi:hypothetical protein
MLQAVGFLPITTFFHHFMQNPVIPISEAL